MAEMRVVIEGGYNATTGAVVNPLPVAGTISGTVVVAPSAPTVVTSLNAATAVSSGAVYDLGYLSRDYTFVGTSSATLTAGVVRLFGSIDGTAFVQIGTDITLSTDFPSATSKAYTGSTDYRYFRADITTTVTGGNITFKILGA
jgi:hypothetical protein